MIPFCKYLLGLSVLSVVSSAQAASIELPQIDINGFANISAVSTNNDNAAYWGAGKDISFDSDTRAGLQFSMRANDWTRFTVQLTTEGVDDYQVSAEWAFAEFRVNPYMDVRAGRLRIPFFLISDSMEVGYSYPWVRPPVDMYGQFGFDRFTGVDTLVKVPVGETEIVFHPHFGTSASDLDLMGMQGTFSVTNLMGLNITWSNDWMNLRIGHTEGDYEVNGFASLDPLADIMRGASGSERVEDQFSIKGRHGQFSGIGFDMDKDNVKIMAEYGVRRTNGLMTNTSSGYLMGGYHFGKFLPHITLSRFMTDTSYDMAKATMGSGTLPDPDPGTPLVNELQQAVGQIIQFNTINQKSVILGLRYDVLPKTALKVEWQRTWADNGSNLMSPPFSGSDTFYMGPGSPDLSAVNVYTMALDLVF